MTCDQYCLSLILFPCKLSLPDLRYHPTGLHKKVGNEIIEFPVYQSL
jgi:hypothetical protein